MPTNPFESPKELNEPRRSSYGLLLWVVAASADAIICLSAITYRLQYTDVFGRRMIPPPTPLALVDWTLLGTFVVGAVLAVALTRWIILAFG